VCCRPICQSAQPTQHDSEGGTDANNTVFVADDHPVVREMICSLLSQEPALRVICQIADGEEAVEKADELRPDLILLDIGLARITGIEAARRIRKVSPESKIIFLSQFDSLHMASEVLKLGGHGFVAKIDAGSDLLIAVRTVCAGRPLRESTDR
jgi:DNA-binding NarL/FixJ family response regulator